MARARGSREPIEHARASVEGNGTCRRQAAPHEGGTQAERDHAGSRTRVEPPEPPSESSGSAGKTRAGLGIADKSDEARKGVVLLREEMLRIGGRSRRVTPPRHPPRCLAPERPGPSRPGLPRPPQSAYEISPVPAVDLDQAEHPHLDFEVTPRREGGSLGRYVTRTRPAGGIWSGRRRIVRVPAPVGRGRHCQGASRSSTARCTGSRA